MNIFKTKQALVVILIILIGGAALLFIGREIVINPLITPLPSLVPTPIPGLSDLIRLEEPVSGQMIKSPLTLKGEARGYWYFEASFPAKVLDGNGVELGIIPVQASGEWMTEDFVPFTAVLKFKKPLTSDGVLVLQKDNPSGLPEHDAELRIPVSFDLDSWADEPILPSNNCKVTGCSGQLCSDEDILTTCEYSAEYACYKTAECKRQEDGKCGWTPTEELVSCLGAAFQAETESQL